MAEKVMCDENRCSWHGTDDKVLRAPSPFDAEETLYACPKCKTVNSVLVACDETGCWKEATCGTPVEDDYRRTCGDHRPKVTPNEPAKGRAESASSD